MQFFFFHFLPVVCTYLIMFHRGSHNKEKVEKEIIKNLFTWCISKQNQSGMSLLGIALATVVMSIQYAAL